MDLDDDIIMGPQIPLYLVFVYTSILKTQTIKCAHLNTGIYIDNLYGMLQ